MGFREISIRRLVLLLQAAALPSPPQVPLLSPPLPLAHRRIPAGAVGIWQSPAGAAGIRRPAVAEGGGTQSKPTGGAAGPAHPRPASGQPPPWQGPRGASPPAGIGQGERPPASLPATWGASAPIIIYSRTAPFFR